MGLKADPAARWPRGLGYVAPAVEWPRGRRLCSLPFGAAYRWELVSGGYAPCGHIHHPRYVRNGHTAEGCPPPPYAQASGRVHRRTRGRWARDGARAGVADDEVILIAVQVGRGPSSSRRSSPCR